MQFVLRCAVWYYSYNLKNVKNTHGGVLLLAKLQDLACNFTKRNTPPWMFFTFFKLCKWYQIAQPTTFIRDHYGMEKKSSLQLLETHAYHENHNIQTWSDMLCKREYFKCGKRRICVISYHGSGISAFMAHGELFRIYAIFLKMKREL